MSAASARATRTDRGNRSHNLTELELVQDRRLTGGIKTDHQNAFIPC